MPIAHCMLPGANGPLAVVPVTLAYWHLPTGVQHLPTRLTHLRLLHTNRSLVVPLPLP